jgi:hypothetical protein
VGKRRGDEGGRARERSGVVTVVTELEFEGCHSGVGSRHRAGWGWRRINGGCWCDKAKEDD